MRLSTVFVICAMILALFAGCSEKKENAEKLEQQMKQMEGQADTGTKQMTDTTATAMQQPTHNASAVPKEEEEVPEGLPMAPASGGYTLQVAACQDSTYARHLVDLYRSRGYQPYVMMAQVGGETYYRIRLGDYDTLAEAKAAKAELKDRFSITPWLTRHGA